MINLAQLERQHMSIKEEILSINSLTEKSDYENYLMEITLHINKLAGLLKIHLLSEDDFMYPALKTSTDSQIRDLAVSYSEEMGDLVTEFTTYKNRFNTKNKVLTDVKEFLPVTKLIISKIKTRVEKEDNNLYQLIAERNI